MFKLPATLKRWGKKVAIPVLLLILILCFIIAYFYYAIFISVHAGHVGVKWERFRGGVNVEKVYPEGFHFNWPWDVFKVFDTRLLVDSRKINVLSRDGLTINLEVTARYRLNGNKAALLYKNFKENYADIILTPEIDAHARLEFSQYRSEEIYSVSRDTIQNKILTAVVTGIQVRYDEEQNDPEPFLYVQDILIKNITLPTTVRKAIEDKASQKHLMLSYEFRLKREKLESQRKEIEALGIRQFQDTIGEGISDRYLRWKGIDATLALASSNNAKVVVIGAGDEGLPLILGNMGSDSPLPSKSQTTELAETSLLTLKENMEAITNTSFNNTVFDEKIQQPSPTVEPVSPIQPIKEDVKR